MANDKKIPWLKLLKIVGEFIVAIVTALFASSYVLPAFFS